MSNETNEAAANDLFQPTIIKFGKDSFFVVEGKTNTDKFYIIQEGKVRIIREVDKVVRGKDTLAGPGDIIAAVSVMSGFSFIETAIAHTDVTVLAVEKKQYGNLIRNNTPIAVRIIQQFSQRLRTLDEMLSRLTLSAAAEGGPSHLLKIAEFYASQRRPNQAFYAYQQYAAHCPDAPDMDDVKQKMERLAPTVKVTKPAYPSDKMERTYPVDCLLFAEGEPGDELYVIQEGSVKISKIMNNQEVVLAVLRKGDIFGEMALLEDKPRAATAEIVENCTVLAVNRANFTGLIETSPELVARMTTLMAERIWLMYRQLANAMITSPLDRIYDALLIQLEKERVPLNKNNPYMCNFGFKELADMARIPPREHDALLRKILLTKRISIVQGKLLVSDPSDVLRQTDYYRRAQQRSAAAAAKQ
ncbi:MAG: cyclic nucleotide-binding domain-containing protein [Treponema sp.]|jgi:CRP-like cAMP-binding protein|nr:cyclic nucleotide-binding domain-containing protein [Treponema sp.]